MSNTRIVKNTPFTNLELNSLLYSFVEEYLKTPAVYKALAKAFSQLPTDKTPKSPSRRNSTFWLPVLWRKEAQRLIRARGGEVDLMCFNPRNSAYRDSFSLMTQVEISAPSQSAEVTTFGPAATTSVVTSQVKSTVQDLFAQLEVALVESITSKVLAAMKTTVVSNVAVTPKVSLKTHVLITTTGESFTYPGANWTVEQLWGMLSDIHPAVGNMSVAHKVDRRGNAYYTFSPNAVKESLKKAARVLILGLRIDQVNVLRNDFPTLDIAGEYDRSDLKAIEVAAKHADACIGVLPFATQKVSLVVLRAKPGIDYSLASGMQGTGHLLRTFAAKGRTTM